MRCISAILSVAVLAVAPLAASAGLAFIPSGATAGSTLTLHGIESGSGKPNIEKIWARGSKAKSLVESVVCAVICA